MGDRRDRPPLQGPVGRLVERVYLAALARRNAAFDAGRGVTTLPVPVISVGNLSVGGTGKTPTVMRVVTWLLDAGHSPVIAMRGYGAKPGQPSDEEAEYHDRLPGVPVVARPDRAAGLAPMVEREEIDRVVLDDGFQHRQIARDLDIVLLDATRPFDLDRCLPAGWLREPPDALVRAHAVVLTRVDQADEPALDRLRAAVRSITGLPPTAECIHEWESVRIGGREQAVDALRGRSAVIACAVGNPSAFRSAADAAGVRVIAEVLRRDHHEWARRDVAQIRRLAGVDALVLATGKDLTKLRRLDLGDLEARLAVPRLAIRFLRGEQDLREAVLHAGDAASGVH